MFDCRLFQSPDGTHSICQYWNPHLTTTTHKFDIHPSEINFTGHPDKGTLNAKVVDVEAELTSVERPPSNLDDQCPAGYTWEVVNAKGAALNKRFDDCEVFTTECAERINAEIREIYEKIPLSDVEKKAIFDRRDEEEKEDDYMR